MMPFEQKSPRTGDHLKEKFDGMDTSSSDNEEGRINDFLQAQARDKGKAPALDEAHESRPLGEDGRPMKKEVVLTDRQPGLLGGTREEADAYLNDLEIKNPEQGQAFLHFKKCKEILRAKANETVKNEFPILREISRRKLYAQADEEAKKTYPKGYEIYEEYSRLLGIPESSESGRSRYEPPHIHAPHLQAELQGLKPGTSEYITAVAKASEQVDNSLRRFDGPSHLSDPRVQGGEGRADSGKQGESSQSAREKAPSRPEGRPTRPTTGEEIDPTPLHSLAEEASAKEEKGLSSTYLPPNLDLEVNEPRRQKIDKGVAQGLFPQEHADFLKDGRDPYTK
jgi:hypothetical protein